MKSTLLITLLCLPGFAISQFRDVEWGTPRGVVRQMEKGKYPKESKGDRNDLLIYFDQTLATYDVTIAYSFVNDSLDGGMYIINEDYVNKNNYIHAFSDLKDQLIIKYGKPLTDETIWHNSLYKNNEEDYGMAVSAGHLQYKAYWIIENTTSITLNLEGENFECDLGVMYNDYQRILNQPKTPAKGL